MLRNDIIYNSLFRLQDIDLNNINNIYFAINIIVVVTTTFFKVFIVVIFILKLVIIIIFNVNIIVIIIVIFEGFIFKLIAFGFDIKKRLTMSASLDKS